MKSPSSSNRFEILSPYGFDLKMKESHPGVPVRRRVRIRKQWDYVANGTAARNASSKRLGKLLKFPPTATKKWLFDLKK